MLEEEIKSSDSNSEDSAFQTPELPASRSAVGLTRSHHNNSDSRRHSSSSRSEGA